MHVLAGVFVRRAVTASRAAALLARAKVNPPRSDLDTVFTLLLLGVFDVFNLFDVFAGGVRRHGRFV